MRSSEQMVLPVAEFDYERENEQIARRTVEQFLADLRNDVVEIRDASDKDASLALRRHQFLLMGAS